MFITSWLGPAGRSRHARINANGLRGFKGQGNAEKRTARQMRLPRRPGRSLPGAYGRFT
jgi:hypothetical protein